MTRCCATSGQPKDPPWRLCRINTGTRESGCVAGRWSVCMLLCWEPMCAAAACCLWRCTLRRTFPWSATCGTSLMLSWWKPLSSPATPSYPSPTSLRPRLHSRCAASKTLPCVMTALLLVHACLQSCTGSPPKAVLLYALYAHVLLGAAQLWWCPAAMCWKCVKLLVQRQSYQSNVSSGVPARLLQDAKSGGQDVYLDVS